MYKGCPNVGGLFFAVSSSSSEHAKTEDHFSPSFPHLSPHLTQQKADPEKLLDGVVSGDFKVVREFSNKVIVEFNDNIGDCIQVGMRVPFRYGAVHYGKNGARIVLVSPNQY